MHWYGGSIAEAVKLSKQKNAIFVVFVEEDSDLSKELADTIENELVLSRLDNQDKFLAIKLKSGSENYTYFAQIYQFVPVPCIFFIGRNGAPLEVVCPGIDSQNLAARIDFIMEEHHKEDTPTVRPSTSAQSVKEKTQNLIQMEANIKIPKPSTQAEPSVSMSPDKSSKEDGGPAAKVQKTDHHVSQTKEYEVVCDGDVCVRKPKGDQASTSQAMDTQERASEPAPSSPNSEASVAEKLETVNMLLELRRQERAETEKELEKQRELERRSVGQGVAELRRWQADQELKQVQEEHKREKMENALARQRILDQIAQDRAERRARDQPAPAHALAPAHRAPGVPATGGDAAAAVARLQLKLPDGGTHSVQLPADAPLQRLHEYIERDLQLPWAQLSLWTSFPRRELAAGEDGAGGAASLRALGLAPSAALLLLPRATPRAAALQPRAASLLAFLTQLFTTMVLEPSYQVYYWIRDRLFPRGGAARGGGRAASPGGDGRPPSPGGARGDTSSDGVRGRRGIVHRLGRAADDDNNTWNGNSTQQM